MSAEGWTPGPWRFVREDGYGGSDRKIITPGTLGALFCDAQYYPWCSDNEADWHLIAAAPAMAKALDEVWAWLESTGHFPGLSEVIAEALAAARGESEGAK